MLRVARPRRFLAGAATLALVAAWAVTLRPASLGGPATYVVVHGSSMLPAFASGDLLILQAAPRLGPGDVVGYRVPQGDIGEGHLVVHRIVGGDAARFELQGDNNDSPDPWHPAASDVVGTVWLAVPGLGRVVEFLHQPAAAGALAVALLMAWLLSRAEPRRPAAVPEVAGLTPEHD